MELKEKLQKLQDNYNKFIEIKNFLETNSTNLKVHDVSYLCYDKEKLAKIIHEKFKDRKEDVVRIINETNMDNEFDFYCSCRFDDFKYELKEIGVDFNEVIRIGRTSSFYMINNEFYGLNYNHNDLVLVVNEISDDIESKLEITYGSIKKWIDRWGKSDIREYIDMYISQSEDLVEEISKWKKAYDYLENFKAGQEEDFIYFFYNTIENGLYDLERERKEIYNSKVSKVIRTRMAHRRKRNEKVIIKIS